MKHTVLHRPVILPASTIRSQDGDSGQRKTDLNCFFVAFGMRAGDLGYRQVVREIASLGEIAHFNEGLVYLTSKLTIDQVFKKINKSIVDPRIPSDVGLLIVDYKNAHAKWYMSREVSEVLIELWHNQNNLFICHNDCSNKNLIYDINALGQAIPLGEHIWYVSTKYSPREAYQILSECQSPEDRLTVFDSTGKAKSWQSSRPVITVPAPLQTQHLPHLPSRATIHQPRQSWQKTMLAEFL